MDRTIIEATLERLFKQHPGFLRETPLMKLPGAALGVACREVWLKLEHTQVSGSFKARGMLNRLTAQSVPDAGVVIASGGNAGIACAAAAQHLGVRCEVFLPEVSSEAKRARLRGLGAQVVVSGAAYADALAASLERQRATGALLAHAYDQPEVVMGAATLAAEIEQQGGGAPNSVLVSVGGGGLIAGIASWFAGRSRVVALEPELAPTLFAARAAGEPVDVSVSGIAADALGAKRIGSIAWGVAQTHVADALLLTDAEIGAARAELWGDWRIAAEASAALGLAALRSQRYVPQPDETVCLVVCGANLDPSVLA
jgi:threonine dehydratase